MKNNLYKYFTFMFVAFSLISAVFSLLAIERRPLLYAGIACTVLTMIVSAAFFFRARDFDNASKDLNKAFKARDIKPQTLELRALKNKAELKEIWLISESIYGPDNVEFDKVLSWWECYQGGVQALYKGYDIVGFLSLWPIKEEVFENILQGSHKEHTITAESILGDKHQEPRTHWYISNIVVQRAYRRTDALRVLVHEALSNWISKANVGKAVKICAQGYSKEGRALLKTFGFSKFKDTEETLVKRPIYLNTSTIGELQEMVNRIAGTSQPAKSSAAAAQ